jgi:hypothetical protein
MRMKLCFCDPVAGDFCIPEARVSAIGRQAQELCAYERIKGGLAECRLYPAQTLHLR